MGKIIVVGSINTDLVFRTSKIPLPGETILAKDMQVVPGGKGANQAIAVARAGQKPIFIAKVGNDAYGQSALENLRKEKMDTKTIFTDASTPSGLAMITVDENSGQNSIVVAAGANGKLTEHDIFKAFETFDKAEILLLQLETPLDTVFYTLKIAKSKGLKTILNPAPAVTLSNEILNYVDIITPNETETEILTGINPDNDDNIKKAAAVLLQNVNECVVITLGNKGAYFLTKNGQEGFVPAEKVKAIDTTAAGDVFNGYLTASLAEGISIKNAIEKANKAAALSVTRKGAQPSIPYKEEILLK